MSEQNCITIADKPSYGTCPECGEVYLTGVATILLTLQGKTYFLCQGEDEMHRCEHCQKEIRGGFRGDTCLVRVFFTLDEASRTAVYLSNLIVDDPKKFRREVVVAPWEGAYEGANYQ